MSPDNSLLIACEDTIAVAAVCNFAAADDVAAVVGIAVVDDVVFMVGAAAMVVGFLWSEWRVRLDHDGLHWG